jgi:tetratricopeptide (TPR) repeat protein
MALQSAVCTNCGGKIKVDDIDLNGFGKCEHCKTTFKVIDVITIDGLPTAKSLLTAANHSMEDGNFEKAVNLFNEILTIKPNCHEAWWGLYTCNASFDRYYGYEDKYGNKGPMTKAQIMTNTLQKYAYRAIEYAPKDIADNYRSEIKESLDYVESVKRGDYDKKSNTKTGCYIATVVYESYSCDEVFALRKFRDEYLAKYPAGRWFIQFYYMVSPYLASKISHSLNAKKAIKKLLAMVIKRI